MVPTETKELDGDEQLVELIRVGESGGAWKLKGWGLWEMGHTLKRNPAKRSRKTRG